MEFPQTRYHSDGRIVHIQTNVELLTFGPEWSDTPPVETAAEPAPVQTPRKGRKQ